MTVVGFCEPFQTEVAYPSKPSLAGVGVGDAGDIMSLAPQTDAVKTWLGLNSKRKIGLVLALKTFWKSASGGALRTTDSSVEVVQSSWEQL